MRERFLASISGKDKILILPLQNAMTDLTNDVSKRSDDVDINSLTSVNQALSSLNRRLSLVSLKGWFAHHPSVLATTYIAIVYLTWLIFLRVVALRYFPLRLLDWAEGLSQFHIRIPEKWGGCEVKVRDLLFLNLFHHSMVLDAWVHKHAETASRAFKDRDVCKGRLTYYPLPLIWNNEKNFSIDSRAPASNLPGEEMVSSGCWRRRVGQNEPGMPNRSLGGRGRACEPAVCPSQNDSRNTGTRRWAEHIRRFESVYCSDPWSSAELDWRDKHSAAMVL